MRACPLTFTHPSEAQQLHGLGPKLCDRLTDKLRAHCAENGLPMPEPPHKARKRNSDEGADENTTTEAPAKKTRKTKPYAPTLRSGPYALIKGLATIPENSAGGLTKVQLMEVAQQWCDSSFSVPSEPGKFYTAWNSMKTLTGKDLVFERGRPTKKYALTEEGWEVAKRIQKVEEKDGGQIVISDRSLEVRRRRAVPGTVDLEDEEAQAQILADGQGEQGLSRQRSSNEQSTALGKELTGADEVAYNAAYQALQKEPGFTMPSTFTQLDQMVRDRMRQQIGRNTRVRPLESNTSRRNEGALNSVNGSSATRDTSQNGHDEPETAVLNLDDENRLDGFQTRPSPASQAGQAALRRARKEPKEADAEFNFLLSSSPPPSQNPNKENGNKVNDSGPAPEFQEAMARRQVTTANLPSDLEPIRLQPGTFSVHLVIDNREVRSVRDRDYISEQLSRRGISPLVRSLDLGDCLWIAKTTDPSLLQQHGEEPGTDEVVLDWIIERKRLDDLVGSIKDGRFHEQKFRLRRSGVRNVAYVIEEVTLAQETATRYHEAIESALASTQVVDGFFVKKTQKLDDTIRYLARMTTLLKSLYEHKTLLVLPSRFLSPQTHLPLMKALREKQPASNVGITFPSFSSLVSKSESLTLRDVFLKMLMCTRGVSGDKALGIQKEWKTPREFMEAFEKFDRGGLEQAKAEKERNEMVFRKLGDAVGRKKIGKVLSAKVAAVWGVA